VNSRAQFIIVATILIGVIVTSLAVSLYLTATQYQEFRYKASKEIVINIDKDFKRTLTRILASATNEYNTTADFNPPRAHAYEKLSYWYQTLAQSYPDAGLQLDLRVKTKQLQPEKTLPNGVEIPERKVENLIKCYWFYPQSISAIYSELAVNLTSHGLYGYISEGYIALNVTIYTETIESQGGKVSFTFHVEREYGEPVSSLSKDNYNFADEDTLAGWALSYFNPTAKKWERLKTSDIVEVTYKAGGNYSLTFNMPYNGYEKYLVLWVRDERGILVEAYSYYSISYLIKENIDSKKQYHPYQTYTLELKPDGTLIWFSIPIDNIAGKPLPPVPPVFVKQFRVFTTINGYQDNNYVQTPHQVERWKIDYEFPAPGFEAERERFMKHIGKGYENRLTFLVNFTHNPNLGVDDTVQRVNVTWIDDCDTPPPQYLISIGVEGDYVRVDNNIYRMRLAPIEGVGLDYRTKMKFSVEHSGGRCEYQLHGIGWYSVGSTTWITNITSAGNFTIEAGPIRAVCYRSSNRVTCFKLEKILDPGPYYHETVILIPYNVKYINIYLNVTWNVNYIDNRYADIVGMASECYSYDHYAYQYRESNQDRIRSGDFNYCNGYKSHEEFKDTGGNKYGYWYAEYGNGFGQALMISNSFIDAMNKLFPKRDEVWIWTAGSYDGRAVLYTSGNSHNILCTLHEYDKGQMTINEGSSFNARFAIWVYSSIGYSEPNEYYKMFVEDYKPSVTMVIIPGLS
jgi:hypothetical protein